MKILPCCIMDYIFLDMTLIYGYIGDIFVVLVVLVCGGPLVKIEKVVVELYEGF